MRGVGATAINRSDTNDVDVVNSPGDPSIQQATKDMSGSAVWVINKQRTGGLSSSIANSFISILNGSPHTQNCDGLMYSWAMGIASVKQYAGSSYNVPFGTDASNPFSGRYSLIQTTPLQASHHRRSPTCRKLELQMHRGIRREHLIGVSGLLLTQPPLEVFRRSFISIFSETIYCLLVHAS